MATTKLKQMHSKRKIKEEKVFNESGTFQSMYAAQSWLLKNGYSYGSGCVGCPVAIRYGPYDLPQKWKNMDSQEKNSIDGIMTSTDWREGEVKVIIYN